MHSEELCIVYCQHSFVFSTILENINMDLVAFRSLNSLYHTDWVTGAIMSETISFGCGFYGAHLICDTGSH